MKKLISLFMALMVVSAVPMNASAEEITEYQQPEVTDEIVETVGYISDYSNTISTGTKKIHMNISTYGYFTMSEIGFVDIDIERSSDNVNFTHERYADDKTITNSSSYHIGDYSWNVSGGYYYRVKVTHYARYGSSTESITSTSNSVWVG